MRICFTSVVLGPLLLMGALPAIAGQSGAVHTHIQLVADNDADRAPFTQKAQEDMQQWRQKLHDFGEKAKESGQQGGAAAKDDLDHAWTKAKEAADRLRTVGADGWQGAKTSYESASHHLADTWNKITSGN
jgi:hypothetical protein